MIPRTRPPSTHRRAAGLSDIDRRRLADATAYHRRRAGSADDGTGHTVPESIGSILARLVAIRRLEVAR